MEQYELTEVLDGNYSNWSLCFEMWPCIQALNIKPYKDGNQWCFLYGENIQDGICGFGKTIRDAALDFYCNICNEEIVANKLKSLRPQSKDETYKEKDEAFKLGKHQLAIKFMNYLDENRSEGKMCLSNAECEIIDKAFKENDWAKIMRYYEKYHPHWKPSKEQLYKLSCIAEGVPDDDDAELLIEIYEQLVKLT